jgi:hypothetical protein
LWPIRIPGNYVAWRQLFPKTNRANWSAKIVVGMIAEKREGAPRTGNTEFSDGCLPSIREGIAALVRQICKRPGAMRGMRPLRLLVAAALLVLPEMRMWSWPTAPKILVQPRDQTAAQGGGTTFTVTATGADLVYYWWANGVPLYYGPDPNFTISNVQPGNAGNYQVVIANRVGLVTSALVTLSVVDAGQTPPTISALGCQSVDKNTTLGPVSFTISGGAASGSDLTVRGNSSNTNLVPNENIFFFGEGTNRSLTIVPASDQSGTCNIAISVTDPNGSSAGTPFELTVNEANVPPEFVGDVPNMAQPFQLYSCTVKVSDLNPADRDHLQVRARVLPEWLSFDPTSGVLSGTPPPGGPEGDEVVLTVEDGVWPPVTNDFRIWTADYVAIRDAQDVAAKRQALIDYIWGAEGWPSNRLVSSVLTNAQDWVTDSLRNEEGNLATLDVYYESLPYGLMANQYHYRPIHGNGELVIFHASHYGSLASDDVWANNGGASPGLVIPALLKAGYSVLAFNMPVVWQYPRPTVTVAGQGEVTLNDHCDLFRYLDRPYRFFVEPIVVALNYVEDQYQYKRVFMTGFSGGGWTTTVYAALDERITGSFPVAGSIPNYLRVGHEGLGDCEQDDSGFYRIANYKELYVMGAYGHNRMQGQILNRYDACCFYGTRQSNWVDEVQGSLQTLGQGKYEFYLDETHQEHKTSAYGLSLILNALPPTLDAPADLVLPMGAGEQSLSLSGIGKAARTQPGEVIVWARSDDVDLISGLHVDYTNGNSSGQLKFSPSSSRGGTATIEVGVRVSSSDLAQTSSRFKVTVLEPLNQPPQVQWLSPTNGRTLSTADAVNLQVEASDADGRIEQVEFRDGTNSLGVLSGAPYDLIWTNMTVGTHILSAVATDDRGGLAISDSINVTVFHEPANHTPLLIECARLLTTRASPWTKSVGTRGGTRLLLRTEGPSGGKIIVEASSDMTNWIPIRTNTLVNGVAINGDPQAGALAMRFYRVRLDNNQ